MNIVGPTNPYNRNGNTHQNRYRGDEHSKLKNPTRRVENRIGLRRDTLSSYDLFSYFVGATLLGSVMSFIGHFIIVRFGETPAVNYIQGPMNDLILDGDAGYSFEQKIALRYGSWDPLEAVWYVVAVYDEKKKSSIGNAHLVLWMSCNQSVQWLGNYVQDVKLKSITIYVVRKKCCKRIIE